MHNSLKKHRILLLGCGKMGQAHAESIAVTNNAELVGVVSRTGTSAQKFAEHYRIPYAGNNIIKALEVLKPDACVIAVSHLEMATVTQLVLQSEIPTLVEKPVALTSSEIHHLADIAESNRMPVMVGMNRRYFPSIAASLSLAQYYGSIHAVTVIAPDPVSPYRAMATYDSKVYDNWMQMNTLHAIDLLRFVAGDVRNITGFRMIDKDTGEQNITASLLFNNGTLGTIISHSSSGGTMANWELRINGTGIEIVAAPFETAFIRVGNEKLRPVTARPEPSKVKKGLYYQLQIFIDWITNPEKPPYRVVSLRDHAKSLELVEALQRLPSQIKEIN